MSSFDLSTWVNQRCLARRQREVLRALNPLRALLLRQGKQGDKLTVTVHSVDCGPGIRIKLTDFIQKALNQLPAQLVSSEDYNGELEALSAAARAIEAKHRETAQGLFPTDSQNERGTAAGDGISRDLSTRRHD